jgi:bifunctional DNA-binding transcriptional regulator/antitoxin component of YhaV-PrlF toxin-antitoxin module
MNTTAKIQHKGQVTIPTSVRRQAGLSKGDVVNYAFQRGRSRLPRLVTVPVPPRRRIRRPASLTRGWLIRRRHEEGPGFGL